MDEGIGHLGIAGQALAKHCKMPLRETIIKSHRSTPKTGRFLATALSQKGHPADKRA